MKFALLSYKGTSSSEQAEKASTSAIANKSIFFIIQPSLNNYNFLGYYTGTNGTGKQIITKEGKLVSGVSPTTFITNTYALTFKECNKG